MADYYPLIARAVAGLDPNATGESRRALYERARTALIAQLRGVQPALSEAEITRERLALEDAVRRVESEAAQRSRSDSFRSEGRSRQPDNAGPASPPPRRGDALRESARAAARVAHNAGPATARGPAPDERPNAEERPTRHLRADPPQRPSRDLRSDPRPSVEEDYPPAGRDLRASPLHRPPDGDRAAQAPPSAPQAPNLGTRGFRDVVADADDLGRAASQANRNARRTYANVPSPSPDFDRVEPDLEQRTGSSPYGYDEAFDEPDDYQQPQKRGKTSVWDEPAKVKSGRKLPIRTILAVGLTLIGLGLVILLYQKVGPSLRTMFKSSPATESSVNGDAGARPKITDRVGQPDSSSQVAPIAQRAVLFEEDPNDPQGKQTVGTVVWRLDQIAPSSKQKPDTAIRADIELPDRKLKVTLTIMRNTDPSMPATSHTIEVLYTVSPDFGNTIANVPGIYAKSPDQPRGTPLAATSVKVQDGYFLIGLSNVDVDRDRNIQVLKERSSLDIPMVYGNQKRAILSLEKGAPGDRVFRDAFAAWGQ
ncbi:MAG: hypothetical protein EKK40_17520 [Bradyrhizobiaceae bacterium]|nr:MAG: hypothetical protein EKK40_17520 [Bradyrhizobiaceae bacterium]